VYLITDSVILAQQSKKTNHDGILKDAASFQPKRLKYEGRSYEESFSGVLCIFLIGIACPLRSKLISTR